MPVITGTFLKDKDPRYETSRVIEVVNVDGETAIVRNVITNRKTSIKITRLEDIRRYTQLTNAGIRR